MLTRKDILAALDSLAGEIKPHKSRTEILMVGGGALVLLYGVRVSTRDLDVLIVSTDQKTEVLRAAKHVAKTLALPEDWLNEAAKGYIYNVALGDVVFDAPSLVVWASAPEQLLAMKLMSWRDEQDIADAALLLSKITGNRDQVWVKIEHYIIPSRETKASYALDELWESLHGSP